MKDPNECLIGSCLAGSGSTSLVFLEDGAGLKTVAKTSAKAVLVPMAQDL